MKLAILGAGVSGLTLLHEISKQKIYSEIILIDAADFYPPCSLNTTATVALRGVSLGHSALGDDLVRGFEDWQNRANTFRSVEKLKLYHHITEEHSRYQKMEKIFFEPINQECFYEEGFLVNPLLFLHELKNNLTFTKVNSPLEKIEYVKNKINLSFLNRNSIEVDQMVVAGGAYLKKLSHLYPKEDMLEKTKILQGSFWSADLDLGLDSFDLHSNGSQIIYSDKQKKIMIGSISSEDEDFAVNPTEIEKIYSEFKNKLRLKIPEFKMGHISTGLRHKASQRRLLIKRSVMSPNIIFWGGQYKNGFILNFYGAKKVIDLLATSNKEV
jgi:glycine/D-amino acid oxidase-like deaminating enzyme